MVMQCPECPQTTEDFEILYHALISSKFDLPTDEYVVKSTKLQERMKEVGASDNLVQLLESPIDDDDLKSREYMKRWVGHINPNASGYDRRRRAARNFMIHIVGTGDGSCENCRKLYETVLRNHALIVMNSKGINPESDPEKLDKLMLKAHFEYLAHPDFQRLLI